MARAAGFCGEQRDRWLSLAAVAFVACCSVSCDRDRDRDSSAESVRAARSASAPSPLPSPSTSAAAPPSVPKAAPHVELAPRAEYTEEPERCKRSDPTCGPLPYMESDRTRYRPGAKRYLLYENDERNGSCEHDGDCLHPHCAECVSRARVPAPHPCLPRGGGPSYARFCGCVQKRCSWFTQTLVLKRLTSIEGLTVHFAGEKVTDAKVVGRVAELLKEQLYLRPCYLNFAHLLPVRHRFVITTIGTYGATDARVTGAAPRLQRCIDEAFGKLLFAPNEISEHFPNTKELQITGVAKVYMGYGVGEDW